MPAGDIPVNLHIYVPDCEIPQTSIEVNLVVEQQTTAPITVNNNGPGILRYAVETQSFTKTGSSPPPTGAATPHEPLSEPWLWPGSDSGDVPPYSSTSVDVYFDATDLADGVYHGQVDITTNDPDALLVSLPVTLTFRSYICGDADGDGMDPCVADVSYVVDWLFRSGDAPPVMEAANVDAEGGVNVADLSYMIDYLFKSGSPPICGPLE
jgi:hypothetical protein